MVLIAAIILAFYLAWNLGANDVANSMGTSVGSKALTLRQALFLAGVLEFLGAVLFGAGVSEKLATGVVAIDRFGSPDTVVRLMLSVLLSAGLWLNLATWFGLPVSSSHATVGAIAGVGVLALGWEAVDWRSIGGISLTWVATPLVSGAIAAGLYWGLRSPWFQTQLEEWIPWVAAVLVGVVGWIVLPGIVTRTGLPVRAGTVGLGLLGWGLATTVGLSGRGLQGVFGKFQIMSAGAVAFAHGSNDVGNAIAPFAVIVALEQNRGLDSLSIPLWVLVLGGLGIVGGLAVWGGKVIGTVGEGLLAIEPMGGFCAELGTAIVVLGASSLGLPVSTSHALVGGVVGLAVVEGIDRLDFAVVRSILLTWLLTIPLAGGLGAIVFWGLGWVM
jgi:inorganic phosphate transporter, PiT family